LPLACPCKWLRWGEGACVGHHLHVEFMVKGPLFIRSPRKYIKLHLEFLFSSGYFKPASIFEESENRNGSRLCFPIAHHAEISIAVTLFLERMLKETMKS
jgi:hypothetical protein